MLLKDSQKHKWMFWTPFNKTLWSLARAIPVLRMSASGTIRWIEDRSDDKTRFAKFGTVVSWLTLPGWRHCCLMFAAVCQWTVLGQLVSQAKTQVALKVCKDSLQALNDYSISYALKVLYFCFEFLLFRTHAAMLVFALPMKSGKYLFVTYCTLLPHMPALLLTPQTWLKWHRPQP